MSKVKSQSRLVYQMQDSYRHAFKDKRFTYSILIYPLQDILFQVAL